MMSSPLFLQDITNANAAADHRTLKSKRIGRFQLLPLSLTGTAPPESHASMRKSPPICTVSLEHATSSCINSMDVNMIPFPSSEASIDSEPDIDCRPHKLRRFSQDNPSYGTQLGHRPSSSHEQHKRRRSASSSRRHSLLSPATGVYTCSTASRPRSTSFSHPRQLSTREIADVRFIAMIRRSVLSGTGDSMDLDDSPRSFHDQDRILVQRLEKYLLERGYREFLGEPVRTSILLSSQPIVSVTRGCGDFDETFSVPCVSPGLVPVVHSRPQTLSRSQIVAALVLRHRNRTSCRQRLRINSDGTRSHSERASSPLRHEAH